MKECAYWKPSSIEDALSLKNEDPRGRMFLAGGTTVMLSPVVKEKSIIDISGLALDYVKRSGGKFQIGALCAISSLIKKLKNEIPGERMLASCCSRIAVTPLRNLITVGGNVVACQRWADLPGAFMALGAEFVVSVLSGGSVVDSVISAKELFAKHPMSKLSCSLLKEVRIPDTNLAKPAGYHKESLTKRDYAIFTISASKRKSSTCLGVTGLAPSPFSFDLPDGSPLEVNALRRLGLQQASSDIHASKEYKLRIFPIRLEDLLNSMGGVSR